MKLKALFEDDGAVSPVIGVILMVAITVILAAVIGTFVLGLGDRVSQASPNTQFTFDYGNDGSYDYAKITHDGGEAVESSQLEVTIGGETGWDDSGSTTDYRIDSDNWNGNEITAGASIEIDDETGNIEDGDEVKVIWTASGSDKTAVIGESEVSL